VACKWLGDTDFGGKGACAPILEKGRKTIASPVERKRGRKKSRNDWSQLLTVGTSSSNCVTDTILQAKKKTSVKRRRLRAEMLPSGRKRTEGGRGGKESCEGAEAELGPFKGEEVRVMKHGRGGEGKRQRRPCWELETTGIPDGL